MNEEEKKSIEELEEFIKGPCEICKYCEGAYKLNRKNIIRLLNLTKKLQEEKAYLQYKLRKKICVEAHEQVKQNYIAKNIIIDKMEELNKEIKSCDVIEAIFKIKQQQILQELLEK